MRGSFADILPGMRFQFVPFDNTPENAHEILGHLGQNIDIVGGIVDESIVERNHCAATILAEVPVRLGMPFNHPLSMMDELDPKDLDGQTIMTLRRDYMTEMDRVRDYLAREHPSCHLQDFGFYDTEAFNAAENQGALIVAMDEWASINPLLRIVPVRWSFTLPFGILHAPDPSPEVKTCLAAFKRNFR